MPFTAFRDALPAGTSYPLGLERISGLFADQSFAVYFVATATWVRQACPLTAARLPVLRVEPQPFRLRVRNEHVKPEARSRDLHIIVYAVPTARKRAIADDLMGLPPRWAKPSSRGFVLWHVDGHGIEIASELPSWI